MEAYSNNDGNEVQVVDVKEQLWHSRLELSRHLEQPVLHLELQFAHNTRDALLRSQSLQGEQTAHQLRIASSDLSTHRNNSNIYNASFY